MESVSLNSPIPIPLQTVKRREMFTPLTYVGLRVARALQAEGSGKGTVAMSLSAPFIRSTNIHGGQLGTVTTAGLGVKWLEMAEKVLIAVAALSWIWFSSSRFPS